MKHSAALALAICGLLYFGPLALDAPLTDPDEGLHASIAQEIYERGDLVVPRLMGHAFRDKPILFFWTQAASMAVLGMTTAAARLPGLGFAVVGVLCTGWLAGVLFESRTRWRAAVCYATMGLPFMLAQAPVHDMAVVPFVVIALGCLWRVGQRPELTDPGARNATVGYVLAAGVAIGLSMLTKGLGGAAVVGVGYGLYVLIARRLSWRMIWIGISVLAVAVAVAIPWYLAMESRDPGYLEYYFVDRHLLGFATDSQPHGGQPWWFYVPLVVFGGLPWVLYLQPRSWFRTFSRDKASPELLLITWFAGTLVLLSLSGSKAPTYLLPAMPAIAILASRLLAPPRISMLVHAGAFVLVSFLAPFAASHYGDQPVAIPAALAFSVVGVLWLWLTGALLRHGPADRAWYWLAASTAITYALGFVLFGPPLAKAHSARDLAVYFNESRHIPSTILVMDERVSFIYYLDPELRQRLREGEVRTVSREDVAAMSRWPPDTVLAVPADLADRLAGVSLLRHAHRRVAGRYLIVGG